MTTAEKIAQLEKEVAALKAVVFKGIPMDDEGEYSEEFIQAMEEARADVAAGRVYRADEVRKMFAKK